MPIWEWRYSHSLREIGVGPRPYLLWRAIEARIFVEVSAALRNCAYLLEAPRSGGRLCGARLWSCLENTSYPLSAPASRSISGGNGFVGARSDPARLVSSARGGCPLSVQLWYPAEPGSGDGPAPYHLAGSPLLSAARWVRTGATLNAALSSRRVRYPVLVSVPGWAGLRAENTTFVQDLASRGFVVAAVGYDDPACAGMNRSAGNTDATDMDFSSQAAFERTHRVADQKIERVANAASQVIDALEVLDRVDPNGRFGGRLDLDRIGVVGYSLGGAIAMQLCWRDDRLKAAVNIDGWFFDAAPGGLDRTALHVHQRRRSGGNLC